MTYDKDSFLAGLSVGMSLRYSKRIPPEPVFIIRVISSSSRVSPNAFYLRGTQLAVDWGDGTYKYYGDHTSGTILVSHAYANSGELFTVKIYFGELMGLLFSSSFGGETSGLVEVLSPIHEQNTITSAAYMFDGCSSLTTIPSNLFANCQNIYSLSNCFNECSSLTTIPSGLFDGLSSATSFLRCFRNCTSLETIPSDLFQDCVSADIFDRCFYMCSGISSSVPELWISHASANGNDCYYGCTNASNYADIPSGWK